jgi:hypothetical protein
MSCCGVSMPDCGNPECELCGRIVPWIREQEAAEAAAKQARLERDRTKRESKR